MTIPFTRRRVLLGLTTGGLVGLLAACGGGGTTTGAATTTPPPATSVSSSANQVTAVLTDFHIQLSQRTYHPGPYTFTAENKGHTEHALELDGPGGNNRTETLRPGRSATLTVNLKSGTYQVFCPVDGHKDLGMKTQITVGGAAAPTDRVNTPTTPPGNGY
ncbi:copper-binding protein [Streptomyces sp. NPDC101490]|uniref:copper-binding protein n=1 Tax=Streptomyces sp. NPDC101490 TaxID=3366143 RepID=UPI00381CEB22